MAHLELVRAGLFLEPLTRLVFFRPNQFSVGHKPCLCFFFFCKIVFVLYITGNHERISTTEDKVIERIHESPKAFEKGSRKDPDQAKTDTRIPSGIGFHRLYDYRMTEKIIYNSCSITHFIF